MIITAPCVLSSLNIVSVVCCFLVFEHSFRTSPTFPLLPFPSTVIFYNSSLPLKWWNCTAKEKYSEYKTLHIHWNQKKINELATWRNIKWLWAILTRNCKINSFPWFILIVSTCMQKCLHIHKHESRDTGDCFQFLVNEYKYLQCILKKKKKEIMYTWFYS